MVQYKMDAIRNQIWKGTESTNKNYLKTCFIPSNSQVYRIKCLHQDIGIRKLQF